MGTVIKATGLSIGSEISDSVSVRIAETLEGKKVISISDAMRGSVDHAVRAAEQCIARANIDRNDIDLLVNVGVYRDNNIAEPAMATLIQQRLGLNLDPVIKYPTIKRTFSFDLTSGACGFIYAAQVIDALFKNKTIKQALIVSGDVHPSKKEIPDFPYAHIGAAVLLTQSDQKEKGFKNFMFKTSEGGGSGVEGYFDALAHGHEGRKYVVVNVQDDYSSRLQEFTVSSIKEYIKSGAINVSDIKFLITSQPTPGFGGRIAESIGLDENSVIDLYGRYGDPHTSALSMGYHIAADKKSFKENDQILFVGAGSGLTSACGLYVV